MARTPALTETSSEEVQVDAESSNSQNVDLGKPKFEPKIHDAQLTVDEAREIAIGSVDEVFTIDSDNSVYPEVRANVPNVDDFELPINTVRMWFLGILFTIVGSGINQFFSMRYPSVTITSLVAQLLSYPLGCLLANALPIKSFRILGRWTFVLNPDHHFNIKEHAVITIMSNLSFGASWATDIIQAQKVFYGLETPVPYQILLALTMQLFGLGLAGLAYKYIVEPPQMIWPATLANAALFETLHSRVNPEADGWKISRYRFFLYIFCGGFVWYWFPGFIFTALSTFAFICWAAPNNIVVNNLFGMSTGLGLMPITFDWSQIAYNGSPLVVPFWAQANVFAGWAFFFALVTPILYYTNTWNTSYLPLSGSNSYDNTGSVYNVSLIVDAHGNFLPEAYEQYSTIFMPATFALGYGISFAVMTCLPMHVYLYHWEDIKSAFMNTNKKDIHARLMSRYKDIPWWWFGSMTAFVVSMAIMVQYVWHTEMPFWGIFIAFAMATVYVIPVGTVYAVANLSSNVLTVLGEIISGYLLPGKPIVMLIFKFYAYTGLSQAMNYASDQKLGLYMKIPRRTLFTAQLVACIIGSLTQNGVLLWMLGHIKGICDIDQPNGYTCPQGRVNFTSSIIWGAIGPSRLYSVGKQYSGLLHLFWIGATLPVITFYLKKRFPSNKFLRSIHWPLFFAGTGNLPPATGINYTTAFAVSFIFNKIIKSRYKAWWSKYNYILSASLDSGVAVSAIVIFFTVIFPGASLSWWGNDVGSTTADGKGTPWKAIPASGKFGPETW
ncbi:probable sexual differentiation process protein ISP4 [Rhynchosporium secalis]|uniref:Probable sexual differentiation process protein ISP4 n=1 Tax=Rhynchosporium secalis TaxID=38038 RepID=A0A1E1MWW0_RHYSE|nr:probable sexual differentiation process protein ISP4 [Rhynchosporium secalis]